MGNCYGNKNGPHIYATLFMGYLEEKNVWKFENRFNVTVRKYFEENWLRYLDDCFIIWKEEFGNINELHNILMNLHPAISFKWNINSSTIDFLDITVIKDNTSLKTDIFYKTTDTHQYLHFKSCHPKACKNNIPYNLARRICTIVSDKNTQDLRLSELEDMLRARQYPKEFIKTGISKAKALREELMSSKKKNEEKIIPFVHTHNPNNPNMFKIIQTSLPTIKNDKALYSKAFKDYNSYQVNGKAQI